MVSALVERRGQTKDDYDATGINDYFHRLANGLPVDNPVQVVTGDRGRWEQLDKNYHPKIKEAVQVVRKWYSERLPVGGSLLIVGGCGCGKTEISRAIADLFGPLALFLEENYLFKRIKDSYDNPDMESEMAVYQRAARADLLVYDDLGAYGTKSPDWVQGIYRSLIEPRMSPKKAFIITTNLSLKANGGAASAFESWVGSRNFSRIMGSVGEVEYVINLSGVPDYRLRGLVR